jgi:hypothetical protein
MQSCGTCAYSWSRLADTLVSCGAPVDDDALRGGEGVNPIWAERKYGKQRILSVMLGGSPDEPPGANPQRLSRDDGRECRMWQAKDDPACSGQAAQCWFRL